MTLTYIHFLSQLTDIHLTLTYFCDLDRHIMTYFLILSYIRHILTYFSLVGKFVGNMSYKVGQTCRSRSTMSIKVID